MRGRAPSRWGRPGRASGRPSLMLRRCIPFLVLLVLAAQPLRGQDMSSPPVDSLVVEGNDRLSAAQIIGTSGLVLHQPITYRDIQRAITALYQTGQFDDVRVEQRGADGLLILAIVVKERPILSSWSLIGVRQLPEQSIRDKVDPGRRPPGRPKRRRQEPRRDRFRLRRQGLLPGHDHGVRISAARRIGADRLPGHGRDADRRSARS